MTLGYHAPPPGAPTGVADYADTLLQALRPFGSPKTDINLYHLGNNRLHAEIYARSLAKPGIIVLHDAVLHHFMLGALTPEQYLEEFVYNYGEWHRHLGEELWRERAACAIDPRYFRYPMLRRAVEHAKAVIVHNHGAAAIAREHGAGNIHVIPHFCAPQDIPDAFETSRFRQRLGIEPNVTLFGIFGYIRETKRVMACLTAFRRLHAVRPLTALLLAGDIVSGDLRRALDSEPPHPAIYRLGHLADWEFRVAAAAVDCCLNLRYPAAGETSGIAIRLMGIGKPVILTDGPETAAIPDTACLRVPSGPDETNALFDQMALVSEFPAIARKIGGEAAVHIREYHGLESVARQYWQVLDSIQN